MKINVLNNRKTIEIESGAFLPTLLKSADLKKFNNSPFALLKSNSNEKFVLLDNFDEINQEGDLLFCNLFHENAQEIILNSFSLFLAYAIQKNYSSAKIVNLGCKGETFFVDFAYDQEFLVQDLNNLQSFMDQNINLKLPFERQYKTIKQLQDLFINNKFVNHFLKLNANQDQLALVKIANFNILTDVKFFDWSQFLCAFKLLSKSSVYFCNDAKQPVLQRIYGTAFSTEKQLKQFLHLLEEQKKSDHRYLNKTLQFYHNDNLIGRGLPMWLPHGAIVKKLIGDFLYNLEVKNNYIHVETPVLGSLELYEKSGHYSHYKDSMFPVISVDESEKFCLRPMTCPHHCIVFQHLVQSYKQLPIKIAENSPLFRYESSGSLSGIERARCMCLNDAHIFLTLDQIKKEFINTLQLIESVLQRFKIKLSYYRLSLRDPNDKEKYYADDAMWDQAEALLLEILQSQSQNFQAITGEAAFYGPKLDIQISNMYGHDVTLATIQLDFLLAKRLNVTYLDANQDLQHPILIHRSLIGTFERFIATLIEQTKGVMPFWLAPIQGVIIPLNNDNHLKYCQNIYTDLINHNYRVVVDSSNERLNYKIRYYQEQKVPLLMIIGDKETSTNCVSVRWHGEKNTTLYPLAELLTLFTNWQQN